MKSFFLSFFLLFSGTLFSQSVVFDNSMPPKPISISGLDVNGTLYDVALMYNIGVDGTVPSGIPMSEVDAARTAIADAMNEINNTDNALIYTVVPDGMGFEWCLTAYNGTDLEWTLLGCGNTSFVPNATQAVAVFTESVPIPTLSQWGIIMLFFFLLIIGVVIIRQNVTSLNSSDSACPKLT